MKKLERELKYQLSSVSYQVLIDKLSDQRTEPHRQTNIYFDTEDLKLRREKMGLRIRVHQGGKTEICLKITPKKKSLKLPLSERIEIEASITTSQANRIISGKVNITTLKHPAIAYLKKILSQELLDEIAPLGKLMTCRTKIHYRGLNWEIDRSEALGKTSFELEVETTQPLKAHRIVVSELKKMGIGVRPLRRSKLQWFFKQKKKGA